jgi:predicted porin
MNKKLLTAAVAAALAAPAAMAGDVTIYGKMHLATTSYDGDLDETADAWDISSHASRLGFKGTEGLSDNLTAVWQIELGIRASDNDNDTTGEAGVTYRNTFVGLTGGWGTAVIGRHDTPLKISTGSLDLFGDTIADYNGNGADDEPLGTGNLALPLLNVQSLGFVDLRVDQAIAYISPNMNGLTIAAAIVQPGMDSGLTTGAPHDADGFAEAYSIAALYSNGPFFASVAYEKLNEDLIQELLGATSITMLTLPTTTVTLTTAIDLDDEDRWRVGLGYTANGLHVGLVYEDQDHAVDGVDAKRWQLSGSYTFGNNVVKLAYGQNDIEVGSADFDIDQWALGLDHNLSKRTKIYAVYTDVDTDDFEADWDGFSLGVVHNF